MQVGIFTVPEGLEFPSTRQEMRRDLRVFARSIGVNLRFVRRKNSSVSYCQTIRGKVVVVESLDDIDYGIDDVIFVALHEFAHWMDARNGLFGGYYSHLRRGKIIPPKKENVRRLGIRAERHCDWLAAKMMQAMYGRTYDGDSFYDEIEPARKLLAHTYGIEKYWK